MWSSRDGALSDVSSEALLGVAKLLSSAPSIVIDLILPENVFVAGISANIAPLGQREKESALLTAQTLICPPLPLPALHAHTTHTQCSSPFLTHTQSPHPTFFCPKPLVGST